MNQVFAWREAPPADFAVIGDPVSHSRSPAMHRAAYAAMGLELTYIAVQVNADEVPDALEHLRDLGLRGVNVTVPHKLAALKWSESPDDLAIQAGAANTLDLRLRRATITDGAGFLDTLEDLGVIPGAKIHLLGAGGTARALAAILPKAGFQVSIWNRSRERAEELAQTFRLQSVLAEPSLDCDVVVNTTSIGLTGDRLPIDWAMRSSNVVAYDLLYGNTAFLSEAKGHGLKTIDGLPLLVAQGARAIEWWLGIAPPREVMMEAVT
jgi:shikimate dehydrogenase